MHDHARSRDRRNAVGRALAVMRDTLGMDVVYVGRFAQGHETFPWTTGEAERFGLLGASVPLEETYCQRVVDERAPNVIPDTSAEPALADLPPTGIGAYVGIPIQFSDGTLYGTLCAVSREAQPQLAERDITFLRVIADLVAERLERDQLEADKRRFESQAAGVAGLLAALEARDGYTGEHSDAVVKLASEVARELGLDDRAIADVEQVALLHDIGKIGIPDSILRKPAALDDAEWELMRQHPQIGERIVSAVPSLAFLAPALRAEHERWDGSGYPDGLAGRNIPIAARICLACDAWHAMVSDRPYRRALDAEVARAELNRHAGTQFCPATVRALLEVLPRRPAESKADRPALRDFSVSAEGLGDNGEVVAVEGELDLITVSQLEAALSESFARADWVVVDLAQTSYIDSSALGVLANAGRAFEQAGVPFALARPRGAAQRTLDLTAASHGLAVEKTRTAAIRRLRHGAVRA